MKLRGLLVVGMIGCGGGPSAHQPSSTVPSGAATAALHPGAGTHREILAVMERYLASPFESAPDALDKIRDFAVQSHDVEIVLDESATPFLGEDLDVGVKNLLMIGFCAGNAASQLRAGARHDDLVAGIQGELQIYRALKAVATTNLKSKKVISPHLDALLDLEANGQLRAHLERALANRTPPAPAGSTTNAASEPADDELAKMTAEGMHLVQAGRAEEAITGYFDKVLASYQRQYGADKRRVYCAHSTAESLLYMLTSANKGEDAIALSPAWADAWFGKSYALTELHRAAEARAALEKAVALSPNHSVYVAELGYLASTAKDWRRSLELFTAAADNVGLIEDPKAKLVVHTRALRGQGYALLELGDLDAGERAYRQSLSLNPNDATSKQELEYIKTLKATAKGK